MGTRQIAATVAAGAAGLAAALALTLTPAAKAYTPDQLPGLGYAVSVLNLGGNCHDWTATGYGASRDLGSDCDAGFQAALDGFVTETCPCAQPPATTATTDALTAPVTTTTAETTTAPPETTTAAETAPGSPAPAPTTTDQTAAVPAAATPACDVQCQIDRLQAQIDDLRTQVALVQRQLALLIQLDQQMPDADPAILAALLATVQ